LAAKYGPADARLLNEVIALKLQFRAIGGVEGWFTAVLWDIALGWSIAPAAVGNLIGGFFLVVLPFWFALRPHERAAAVNECSRELPQPAPAG
jgi:hypothetical protein